MRYRRIARPQRNPLQMSNLKNCILHTHAATNLGQNGSKSSTNASSISSLLKALLSASVNSPSNSCEKTTADSRTLPADDLDPLNPLPSHPVLVKISTATIRTRHVNRPTSTHRQHWREGGLHLVTDISRLVGND